MSNDYILWILCNVMKSNNYIRWLLYSVTQLDYYVVAHSLSRLPTLLFGGSIIMFCGYFDMLGLQIIMMCREPSEGNV